MENKEEKFVVVRGDNRHYIKSADQSQWVHNIANAKIYTEKEAEDKIAEIEASDFEYRVYASPLKKEHDWYRATFG